MLRSLLQWRRSVSSLAAAAWLISAVATGTAAEPEPRPFTLVVMDPLCSRLACDCVKGYAQRDYEKLGEFLRPYVGRPVKVVFSESLEKALAGDAAGHADLVIGKYSVILADAKKTGAELTPIAQLSGKDGATTQTGLVVVLSSDPAQSVSDLQGYRVFFGPADCDEKSAAPMRLLEKHGIAIAETPEVCASCSDAAVKLLELGPDVRAAGVLSSYAEPLLAGCGTVKKGDLRIIGETPPLPFITAFVDARVPESERAKVLEALNEIQYHIEMLVALESKNGFVPFAIMEIGEAQDVAKKND